MTTSTNRWPCSQSNVSHRDLRGAGCGRGMAGVAEEAGGVFLPAAIPPPALPAALALRTGFESTLIPLAGFVVALLPRGRGIKLSRGSAFCGLLWGGAGLGGRVGRNGFLVCWEEVSTEKGSATEPPGGGGLGGGVWKMDLVPAEGTGDTGRGGGVAEEAGQVRVAPDGTCENPLPPAS